MVRLKAQNAVTRYVHKKKRVRVLVSGPSSVVLLFIESFIESFIGTQFSAHDNSQPPTSYSLAHYGNRSEGKVGKSRAKAIRAYCFLFGQRVYYGWSQEQFLGITEVREINPVFSILKIMKRLDIYLDESGDLSLFSKTNPFYAVCFAGGPQSI